MEWYRRLADVPGVYCAGTSAIDRTKLDGYDFEPEVHEFEFDGKLHRSLSWPSAGGGSTSASPVHQRAFDRDMESSPSPTVTLV